MHIRFVLMNAYGVGGTIRATFTLAAALAERHDVEIASVLRSGKQPELPLDPAVRLIPLTDVRPGARRRRGPARRWALEQPSRLVHREDRRYRSFSLLSDAKLLRYLRSARDGAVIGTRPGLNLVVARYARRSAVRIGQDHLTLGRYGPGLKKSMARRYPNLDALTALTETTAQGYRELLGGKARVETIPNAVRPPGTGPSRVDAKLVVSAGRLTGQKGFDRLLPVWADVSARHPDWELRIYGSGRGKRRLRRLIRTLGLEGRARLMGHSSRLAEELAAASVYVMASRYEGFPMVLLEAMSIGLPVVSFDCPTGPAEIVTNGVDGYVVADGDGDALGRALTELMEDADRRRAFGAAALEKAASYEPAAVAARFEALLEELAAAKGSRAARAS